MFRVVRQLGLWGLLAFWSLLAAGGPGLHLLCEHDGCSEHRDCSHAQDAACEPVNHSRSTAHSHCHHHASFPESSAATDSSGKPGQPAAPHDSEHCQVCQFFHAPQRVSSPFVLPVRVEHSLPRFVLPVSEPFVTESWEPQASRAPPVAA